MNNETPMKGNFRGGWELLPTLVIHPNTFAGSVPVVQRTAVGSAMGSADSGGFSDGFSGRSA